MIVNTSNKILTKSESVMEAINPKLVPKHGIDSLGRRYTRFVNPEQKEESYSVSEFLRYSGKYSFSSKFLVQTKCIELLHQQLNEIDFF